MLGRAKGAPPPDLGGKVRVLGADDFAFRKGHAYGTILVDLGRRRVVDLLPERSAESLARWLEAHPGVEVAARDRSFAYANAIAAGAPGTAQLADRWHLLHKTAGAQEGRRAGGDGNRHRRRNGDRRERSRPHEPNRPRLWYARQQEEAAEKRHQRLVERWCEIRHLYLAGMELREISRTLGINVRSVYRYKDLTEPPPRPARKRRASSTPTCSTW